VVSFQRSGASSTPSNFSAFFADFTAERIVVN
jgi:hypothetical protein